MIQKWIFYPKETWVSGSLLKRNICWTVKGYMCVHSKLNEWCHKHGGLWELPLADKSINWISVFIDCSSQGSLVPLSEGDGKYRSKSKVQLWNPLLVPHWTGDPSLGCGVCTSVTIRWDEKCVCCAANWLLVPGYSHCGRDSSLCLLAKDNSLIRLPLLPKVPDLPISCHNQEQSSRVVESIYYLA